MSLYNPSGARRSLFDTLKFRGLSQIATVLSYIILVRGMPKSDFGIFNVLYSFIPVFGSVASFGLEQILRRYQPEYLRAGNVAGAVSLVRIVASARFALNVLFVGIVLWSWNLLAPIFHLGPYRIDFAFFAALLILHFQVQILTLSLASRMLHRFSVGAVALLSTGKLAGYCVMLYLGAFSLRHAIFADTAAYAIVYVFMLSIYRGRAMPKERLPPYRQSPDERKRMIRYGLFNNFNDTGSLLLGGATDNFFIAAFIDPVRVGVYAFYGRLNDMAINLLPVRLFDNIIQPLFFSVQRNEAEQRIPRLFTFLIDINVVLLWAILAFSIVYHADLVKVLFAGKFIEYSWLLPLIVFFSTVNSISVPVTLVTQHEEKAEILLYSKVFVAYNLIAMVVLIPIAGIYGAMLARGSAEAFKNAFVWWCMRHRAKWTNARAVLVTALLLWGSIVAVCYAVKHWVHAPAIVHLAFGIVACAAGLLVYLRSPALARSDREILRSVFHGGEGRLLRILGLSVPVAG
jgi:O-antigen/teichoic acid export membrane protein